MEPDQDTKIAPSGARTLTESQTVCEIVNPTVSNSIKLVACLPTVALDFSRVIRTLCRPSPYREMPESHQQLVEHTGFYK